MKPIEYRPLDGKLTASSPFDGKISGFINGYIVSRVFFDDQYRTFDLVSDLTPYCEWSARYMDPEHYLIILIDIDPLLVDLVDSLQQLRQLWSKDNIIIKTCAELQEWIGVQLKLSKDSLGLEIGGGDTADCCEAIEKEISKLLS